MSVFLIDVFSCNLVLIIIYRPVPLVGSIGLAPLDIIYSEPWPMVRALFVSNSSTRNFRGLWSGNTRIPENGRLTGIVLDHIHGAIFSKYW